MNHCEVEILQWRPERENPTTSFQVKVVNILAPTNRLNNKDRITGPDKRQTAFVTDYVFELDRGSEQITQPDDAKKKSPNPVFFGYCYYCDCAKHSQNYCPLRYCQFCASYGHSAKVCPKNSAQGNNNWRKKPQNVYHHFKYWRKPQKSFRYANWQPIPVSIPLPVTNQEGGTQSQHGATQCNGFKIPFGSTWKQTGNNQNIASDWRQHTDDGCGLAGDYASPCGVIVDFET
jgi:hypothetical protein